jgi:hypothetical protein
MRSRIKLHKSHNVKGVLCGSRTDPQKPRPHFDWAIGRSALGVSPAAPGSGSPLLSPRPAGCGDNHCDPSRAPARHRISVLCSVRCFSCSTCFADWNKLVPSLFRFLFHLVPDSSRDRTQCGRALLPLPGSLVPLRVTLLFRALLPCSVVPPPNSERGGFDCPWRRSPNRPLRGTRPTRCPPVGLRRGSVDPQGERRPS